jgi:hypothetical protein
MELYWYMVELEGGNRFIETDMDIGTFKNHVVHGICDLIFRQLVAVPTQDASGAGGVVFVNTDQVSIYEKACDKQHRYFNFGRVLSFMPVDKDSDVWMQIREKTLKEKVVVTPSKKLVLPE